jgi:hypothetical protein
MFRYMLKRIVPVLCLIGVITTAKAQVLESYVHAGEFGISLGGAHYYGDLNTRASINRPKISAGVFFTKQFNNYIGIKIAGNYAKLGYSDMYSKNEVQKIRNLSFNSNIWELSLSGQFNFFKFYPGIEGYTFTPYVSLGVGIFSYDPYAFITVNGEQQKVFLRPLGTEGQGQAALYPEREPYSSMGVCIPLTVGFKYNLSPSMNFFAEAGYRYTNTDYLDDVSTTYAPDAFVASPNGQPSLGYLLQDRSYEYGTPIGIKGRQRGNSKQKDGYMIAQVGISFNLSSYRCPNPY